VEEKKGNGLNFREGEVYYSCVEQGGSRGEKTSCGWTETPFVKKKEGEGFSLTKKEVREGSSGTQPGNLVFMSVKKERR